MFYTKRAGLAVAALGLVSYGIYSAAHSERFARIQENTGHSFAEKTANAGFRVRNLLVEGREYTSRAELKSIIGLRKGNSIFSYDLENLQTRISSLPWVKSSVVERRLPDTIYVRLEERRPVALWQRDGKLALVDAEGIILTEDNLGRFSDMIVVTGENAPQNAPELVGLIEAEPDLRDRVDIARWIGNRRWDIRLKNGITVRLPEEDAGLAIKRLAEAQAKERVMDRHVEAIDLRDPLRIVIQTAPDAVEKFEAGYKREKNI